MKKRYIIYLLPILMVLIVSSCNKTFEADTQNANVPNSVASSLLLNGGY